MITKEEIEVFRNAVMFTIGYNKGPKQIGIIMGIQAVRKLREEEGRDPNITFQEMQYLIHSITFSEWDN